MARVQLCVLLLLLGLLGACTGPSFEEIFPGAPAVGSSVTVTGPEGGGSFVMATSPTNAHRVFVVEERGNLAQYAALNSSGISVGWIGRGTRGKVLDVSRLSLPDETHFISLQLEIAEGPRRGVVGWVPLAYVAAEGERDGGGGDSRGR